MNPEMMMQIAGMLKGGGGQSKIDPTLGQTNFGGNAQMGMGTQSGGAMAPVTEGKAPLNLTRSEELARELQNEEIGIVNPVVQTKPTSAGMEALLAKILQGGI